MKAKQISIILEQHRHTETRQHHGGLGEGFTTEEIETHRDYHVIQMRNSAKIDLGSRGPNDLRYVRVGDVLTEAQAEELARYKVFDVTIKA